MQHNTDRRTGLRIFTLVCLLLFSPAALFFLVNLEIAIRVFVPSFVAIPALLPESLRAMGVALSVDLSAISTLVPVLLLAFPLYHGARILRAGERAQDIIREMKADPYPPHFAFFLVMLGLVGTLYGMMIGLGGSGVSTIGEAGLTRESVQETLDLLIQGTATAILSSLVGIIGAFIAARPVPWMFRQLTGISEEGSRRTLSDTLNELTHDLQNLGAAGRELTRQIPEGALPGFLDRIGRMEVILQEARDRIDALGGPVGQLRDHAGRIHDHAARLEVLEQIAREQLVCLTGMSRRLESLDAGTASLRDAMERHLAGAREQGHAMLEQLTGMTTTTRESVRDARQDREALRRALAGYAANRD